MIRLLVLWSLLSRCCLLLQSRRAASPERTSLQSNSCGSASLSAPAKTGAVREHAPGRRVSQAPPHPSVCKCKPERLQLFEARARAVVAYVGVDEEPRDSQSKSKFCSSPRARRSSSTSSLLLLAVAIVAITCFFNHVCVFFFIANYRPDTCPNVYWWSVDTEMVVHTWRAARGAAPQHNVKTFTCERRPSRLWSIITAINHIIDSLLLGKPPQD